MRGEGKKGRERVTRGKEGEDFTPPHHMPLPPSCHPVAPYWKSPSPPTTPGMPVAKEGAGATGKPVATEGATGVG